jgi:sulfatase maturation enzyme AslB (radical SAM superfamily)
MKNTNEKYYEVERSIHYRVWENNGKKWRLSSYPYLDVVLGDACNAGCSFCVACLKHKSTNLKIDANFKEKLRFAIKEMGVKEILLLGGEPTIYNTLFDAIHIAKGYKELNKICVTTNGQRLKDYTYLKKLMESGVTNVNLSVMSPRALEQLKYNGGRFSLSEDDLERIYRVAKKNNVHLRIQANSFKGLNDTPEKISNYYMRMCDYADSIKMSPLLQTDSFSTIPKISDWNKEHILTPEQYDELFDAALNTFQGPYLVNNRTLGFVTYKMTAMNVVPFILNYNHRGRLMKLVVDEGLVHGAKILPTGELSMSWNRELTEYFINTSNKSARKTKQLV